MNTDESDKRCFEDIFAVELLGPLAPKLEAAKWSKFQLTDFESLPEADRFFFKERQDSYRNPRKLFLDDRLAFVSPNMAMVIAKYANPTPYIGTSPSFRVFPVHMRYDLSAYPQMGVNQAVRLLPPDESLDGLTASLRAQFNSAAPNISSLCGFENGGVQAPQLYTKRFPADGGPKSKLPLDKDLHQLYFTNWVEYALPPNQLFLDGEKKQQVLEIFSTVIASLADGTSLYIEGQLGVYKAQVEVQKIFSNASMMPARGRT